MFAACSKEADDNIKPSGQFTKTLTIFFVHDLHGQLDNFSKIKHIVDQEKREGNVIVACSGDIFSGNPVVDNYPDYAMELKSVMRLILLTTVR